ncbi:MAG: alkaline phosphatase family protein, partial [Ktedonobacteraceae bacterium]
QMLGCFKEVYPDLEGIRPNAPGANIDTDGSVYSQAPTTERQMWLDPHHEVPHVRIQLKDGNGGFVRDFSTSYPQSTKEARQFIMGYYPLDSLPALHALGREFTICDHWHSSLPGPTWPNRFFALSGTSNGRVDMPGDGVHGADLRAYFHQTQDTLFDRLNERGVDWKVYFHDVPQTTVFSNQREPHNAARYFYIHQFFDDARGLEAEFPQFSLIEPNFMGWGRNDDHPPHDIMRAEKLIADVYNAIHANDTLWQSTLLAVFYDEHGGFYDHVVPPPAIPPDDLRDSYSFDQYGLRVPAILISPWVEQAVEPTLFDHTSVLKYLTEKWQLGPLGHRTATANSIGVAISCTAPRANTCARIEMTADELRPPDPEAEEKAFDEVNAHQTALTILSRYLAAEGAGLAPRVYSGAARIIEWLKMKVEHLFIPKARRDVKVSVALVEPDRLAHHVDVGPKNNVANFLIRRKQQAVAVLANAIRNDGDPIGRDHALRTLSLITGRKYDREPDGLVHARNWLARHGT